MFGWRDKHYGVQPMLRRERAERQAKERTFERNRGYLKASKPRLVIIDHEPLPRDSGAAATTGGGEPGVGNEVSQYLITSEQADTVTSGSLVIAKPFPLRGAKTRKTIGTAIFEIFPAFVDNPFVTTESRIIAEKVGASNTQIPGVEWLARADGRTWIRRQ